MNLLCFVIVMCGIFWRDGVVAAGEVSFRNDVMAVMSKAGCNLGTCHGNARGKGGFQISLRGQDPENDFRILTRDWRSRRVNVTDPDLSLLLLKPTQQIAHEGGRRFDTESIEYQILKTWIAAGMPDDRESTPRLTSLSVTPPEAFLVATPTRSVDGAMPSGWSFRVSVTARFSDGSSRDVSSLAVYELAQPIADVSHDGVVTGLSAGETTVLVRYLDQQVAVRVAFIPDRPQLAVPTIKPANLVDEQVFAKLARLRIRPSDICDDATFVRRVYLDLLGIPPTAAEAMKFVSDPATMAIKRGKLIDQLLERPEFADWWALKWSDLLRVEEKTLDRKGVENFHGWLRDAFATNKPLDQMVREIVAGRGSTYEVPPANFYRALRTPFERSETVGQLFLGVRLQCARCHNHPFDRWTQNDYYGWGSVFASVDYKIIENRRRDTNDKHEFDGEQIVFLNSTDRDVMKGAKDPRTDAVRPPLFLGARSNLDKMADPLEELATWMTDVTNDRFVTVLANRTWQQVMGRGIVDPVDDFRATNPPSNPELLASLVRELRSEAHRFDLRHLLRLILNSSTYQLSSEPNDSNRDDETNFSRAVVKRLSAEQILDAASMVCDVPLEFTGYPRGPRAAQIPGIAAKRPREEGPSEADRFLKLFGKPPRLQSCDCERSEETTLNQTFQLVSGSLVNRLLTTPDNRLSQLLNSGRSSREMLNELYWTILTRPADDEELRQITRYLEGAPNRRAALEDITWSLMNSNEFLLRR